MTERSKTKVSPESLDRLFDKLAGGLSDEDVVGYALNRLSPEDALRIKAQLASMPEEQARVDRVRHESAAWSGDTGNERLDRLARRIEHASLTPGEAVARLRAAIGRAVRLVPYQPAFLADDRVGDEVVDKGEAADGLIRWEISRTPDRDLRASVWTWAVGLAGVRLRLRSGAWSAECILELKTTDELGAEVPIDDNVDLKANPLSIEAIEGGR